MLLTTFSPPLAALVATVPGRELPTPAAVLVGLGTVPWSRPCSWS
ncbi:hypothetical protein [Streptomyces sp. NPDC050856]